MSDVVDLIMEDHREVERLFDRMKAQPDQRPMLVPVLMDLLVAHSRAEEMEVYPVGRDEAGLADEVEHSQEEHAEAEELMERLAEVDHTTAEFDTLLEQVIESVSHHIEEEEAEVLPGLRQGLSEERLGELGEAFVRSRAEHMGQQPGEATRDELEQQARNAGVEGTSSMTKDELKDELG